MCSMQYLLCTYLTIEGSIVKTIMLLKSLNGLHLNIIEIYKQSTVLPHKIKFSLFSQSNTWLHGRFRLCGNFVFYQGNLALID